MGTNKQGNNYFILTLFILFTGIFIRVYSLNSQTQGSLSLHPVCSSFFALSESQPRQQEKVPFPSGILSACELLNDSIHQYIDHSASIGLPVTPQRKEDLSSYIEAGWLYHIRSNDKYFIDDFAYSYPYLIPEAAHLLNTVSKKFQIQLKDTDLAGTRFVVSSMLRTSSSLKKLSRVNKNASPQSAHLHGTAFDISYEVFFSPQQLTRKKLNFLKEKLAETLFELRSQNKCWVTFEKKQTCFHIVVR